MRIPQLGPPPGEFLKPGLWGPAFGNGFFGILVAQLIERKIDGLQKRLSLRDGVRAWLKQPLHFLRRLEMPFRIDLQPRAGSFNRYTLPDTGENILQIALPGGVIEHVIGGDQRHSMGLCQKPQMMETAQIITLMPHARPKPEGNRDAREFLESLVQTRLFVIGHHDQAQPRRGENQIGKGKDALPLFRLAVAAR